MKSLRSKLIGGLLAFGLLTGLVVASAAPALADIAYVSPTGTVSMALAQATPGAVANGGSFTINLNLANPSDLSRAWQAVVQFDSTKLSITPLTDISYTWNNVDSNTYHAWKIGASGRNVGAGAPVVDTTNPTAALISGLYESVTAPSGTDGITDPGSTYVTLTFHAQAAANNSWQPITLVTSGSLISFINNNLSGTSLAHYTLTSVTNANVQIGTPPAETLAANSQTVTVNQFSTNNAITVSATDTNNPNGNPVSFTVVGSGPSHGTLGVMNSSTGAVTYTPNNTIVGTGVDSFQFQAAVNGLASTGTITINVTFVNQAPVAQGQNPIVPENGQTATSLPLTLHATDLDSSVTGAPAETLTYSVVSPPSHGALSGLPNTTGAVTYTPTQYYSGADTFTFKANDGTLDSNVATVSITVTPVNQAPTAQDMSVNDAAPNPVTFFLASTDPDTGETFTYAIVSQPNSAQGSLSGLSAATGQVTFTPASGYAGDAAFTFKVTDSGTPALTSNTATVTVHVISGAVPVDAGRPAYITFTAPSGTISWTTGNTTASFIGTKDDSTKWTTVDANVPWSVYVSAQPGCAPTGHMTKYNSSTGTYDTSASLSAPLNITATGAVESPATGVLSAMGRNGQSVALSLTNQTLASATNTDFSVLNSYLLGYGLDFSQAFNYIDPGLPLGFSYHVLAQFTSQASY